MKKSNCYLRLICVGLVWIPFGKVWSEPRENNGPPVLQVLAGHDDPLIDESYKKLINLGYKVTYQKRITPSGKYILDGVISVVTAEGDLIGLATYRNGLPDGIEISWYETGQIATQSEFIQGRQSGVSRIWSKGGVMTGRELYSRGKKTGKHAYWSEDGKPVRAAYWVDGDLQKIELYENGVPPKVLTGMEAKKYVIDNFKIDRIYSP
jgi:hypothetical protein